jgi:hypothetical protein
VLGPPVVGVVLGVADRGAHHLVKVVGPQSREVFADEGAFGQPQGRGIVGEAGGLGGQR